MMRIHLKFNLKVIFIAFLYDNKLMATGGVDKICNKYIKTIAILN